MFQAMGGFVANDVYIAISWHYLGTRDTISSKSAGA